MYSTRVLAPNAPIACWSMLHVYLEPAYGAPKRSKQLCSHRVRTQIQHCLVRFGGTPKKQTP